MRSRELAFLAILLENPKILQIHAFGDPEGTIPTAS
jgi:hypothetical protein